MKVKSGKFYIILTLILGSSLCAQADLAARINRIVNSRKTVHYSIRIVEADTGREVYEYNARDLTVPASNMKLITTAAALRYLGADFVYRTKVGLYGDTLVVIGSGDPLLGDRKTDQAYGRETDWIFKDIAEILKNRGIRTINDIIVDTTVFDDDRVHSSWPKDQLNRWYACEVSGLNYNDNCVDIIARNINGTVVISTDPATNFITMINKVQAITEGESAVGSLRNTHPNKLTITGRCKTKATLADIAIERPAGFFGFLLAEHLAAEGIKAKGHLIEKPVEQNGNYKLLTEYTTSIKDCITRCNKNSLGLAAEALLKTIAAHQNPDKKNGSWKDGSKWVGQYLSELGLDESQYYIDDGSGLSKQNELTAYTMTTVLLSLYNSSNWQMFKDTLSIGGVDGTLQGHFKENRYKGKILGKTGYIAGVKSLSGICITDKGEYIFSVLGNNGPSRSSINCIAQAIIDDALDDSEMGPEPNQIDTEEDIPGT